MQYWEITVLESLICVLVPVSSWWTYYVSHWYPQMRWVTLGRAPEQMVRGATAVDGSTVNVTAGYSHRVWTYDLKEDKWTGLPDCPQWRAGLTVVSGVLTAVGGRKNDWGVTGNLVSLAESHSKWVEHFPPMPVKQKDPAAVCTGNHLVVVADMVRVMDTTSLKWFSARSLPVPLPNPSLAVCGTELYVLGYMRSVFSYSLPTLLQSLSAVQPQTTDVWRRLANVPVNNSTLTTWCGQLIAVGGENIDLEPVDTIHLYNPSVDSWHIIGHMPTARSNCLVATLPGDTLVVIGGVTREGNTERLCNVVEVGYFV